MLSLNTILNQRLWGQRAGAERRRYPDTEEGLRGDRNLAQIGDGSFIRSAEVMWYGGKCDLEIHRGEGAGVDSGGFIQASAVKEAWACGTEGEKTMGCSIRGTRRDAVGQSERR